MQSNIDTLPTHKRVYAGKMTEAQIAQTLLERYKFPLEDATFEEDCNQKTDKWYVHKDGKRERVAIKARVSGHDILIAVRDPWYGKENPECEMGRDMLYKYMLYVTLSEDSRTIRVAAGKRIKEICRDMWYELQDRNYDISKSFPMRSAKHPGSMLRYHQDAFKVAAGKPNADKILAFIPPEYLQTGKEIWYFPNI